MHDAPAVSCTSCERTWHSQTMLEGLALLGACPRCGGALAFHREPPAAAPRFERDTAPAAGAPHLVLGFPRTDRRD